MITTAPWWIFDYCQSASEKFKVFHVTIKHVLDVHAPLRSINVKARKKKWISPEFDTISRKVEKAGRKYKASRDQENFAAYKIIRNKANRMKTKLKYNAIKISVTENLKKSKKAWEIMNCEIGRGKISTKIPNINNNGEMISDAKEKLNLLASHFSQNPDNKKANMQVPESFYTHICEGDCDHLDKIRTSPETIISIITKMDSSKPSGLDNIPMKFYKTCMVEIVPIMSILINSMFKEGIFPDELKKAKIWPLYKQKGSRSEVKNYRPMSLLLSTAKIIEKVLSVVITNYLERTDKIMPQQHGYRRNPHKVL